MYSLDTNTIIYYLNNEPAVVKLIDDILASRSRIYVSTITEIELFSFPQMNSMEFQRINDILSTVSLIGLNSAIARVAGSLRRFYHLPLADSAIAATALFTGSTLLTRNIKDFQKVPNLTVRKI